MLRPKQATIVATVILGVGLASAQEKQPPFRGVLYANWTKLGLTEKQRKEVYKIQGEHRKQVAAEEAKAAALTKKERIAAIKVLDDGQKKKLAVVGNLQFRRLLKELESTKEDPVKEPAKPADDPPKGPYRGVLYPNWTKLSLSKDQVQKIYKIQTEHRGQIRAIRAKIKDLNKQEKIAAIKLLTAEQKTKLAEVGTLEFRQLLKELDKSTDTPKPTKP